MSWSVAANGETPRERLWLRSAHYEMRRRRRPLLLTEDMMTTRRVKSLVSMAPGELPTLIAAALGLTASAGAPHPPEPEPAAIRFDNEATVQVDVYLVSGQFQWRLGRVPPGMRAMLRVPESAIESTMGFVRVAVIPGSPMSAQADESPRAVFAIMQPVSEVLSQRWTFRQPAAAALQLEGTRLAAAERP
jgi:hypothetical protein